MSLRWRIMGATVVVVLLTVLASIGVGYYATQARLGVFVERIGRDEAAQLARNLSREYTERRRLGNGGPGPVPGRIRLPRAYREGAVRGGDEGEHLEGFHQDPVRVVIVGTRR